MVLYQSQFSSLSDIWKILEQSGYYVDLELMFTVLEGIHNLEIENINPEISYFLKRQNFIGDLKLQIKDFAESKRGEIIKHLSDEIRNFIIDKCKLDDTYNEKMCEAYNKFFTAIGSNLGVAGLPVPLLNTFRSNNIDIFTTNYDINVEYYFEQASYKLRADIDLLNDGSINKIWKVHNLLNTGDHIVRLFKLHGSIDQFKTKDNIVKTGQPDQIGHIHGDKIHGEVMIYPVREKYLYTYPFHTLLDCFRDSLIEARALISVGYSFRDEAINNIIEDAMHNRKELNRKPLKLYVLNPNAEEIINLKLSRFEEIEPIPINAKFDANGNLQDKLEKTFELK